MLNKDYEVKTKEYFSIFRFEMVKYLPQNSHYVLDIGCGSGNLGAYLMQEKGCVVWGVEPQREAAKEACKKLGRVINKEFDDTIDFGKQKFDAIYFNDVLEHFIDPLHALLIAKKYLEKEGVVISSIPNIRYYENLKNILFGRDWKYTDMGILDNTHLRFFTSKSIIRLFEESGYEIIKHEGINSLNKYKLKVLEVILPKYFSDMKFLQFATVAKPKR
jgi:2-polyprenyl-3-methyl-5-hydroxy-6-metoxy-1,4-benzoquinol methylase